MREEKLKTRKIKIVFYSVSLLLMAQVIWWTWAFLGQVQDIGKLKMVIATGRPIEQLATEREVFHKRIMFLSESAFFLLATGAGIFALYRALRVEERARQAQKSFVEIMSHESKTPLTALKLRLESVIEKHRQDSELDRDLQLSLLEVRRLSSLFDKAMSLSRAERDAFRPELLDVKTLVKSVVARVEPVIRNQQVEISSELSENLLVLGDRDGLQSAIQSLLENAIYYNDKPNRAVRISAESRNSQIVLKIDDNGPGISDGEQGRVFEKFYRGERQQGVPGSGLGLYLARQIAGVHQGSLNVERSDLGGARFLLALPKAAGEAA